MSFHRITLTADECAVLPAASYALTCNRCVPRFVDFGFHFIVNGAVTEAALNPPATYSSTLVTPTLSLAGDQVSAMLVPVRVVAVTFVGAVGGAVSLGAAVAHAGVDATRVVLGPVLPAASWASTAYS